MTNNPVVCIATGPSLTPDDVNYVKGKLPVITINNACHLAPWADYHYACDLRWWRIYHDTVGTGECWTIDTKAAREFGLNLIKHKGIGPGLCTVPGRIYHGGNSGYQAIGLAYVLGYNPIYLLGYDCQATNGKKHCHPDHPGRLDCPHNYRRWRRRFNALAQDAKRLDVTLINCSRETAITDIPRANLCDVL